jgi:hypothetical protein
MERIKRARSTLRPAGSISCRTENAEAGPVRNTAPADGVS